MSIIWPLPKVTVSTLSAIEEKRPTALITSDEAWSQVGHLLNLPLVVQAEPMDTTEALMRDLASNLPSQVEVVYAVGNGIPWQPVSMLPKPTISRCIWCHWRWITISCWNLLSKHLILKAFGNV